MVQILELMYTTRQSLTQNHTDRHTLSQFSCLYIIRVIDYHIIIYLEFIILRTPSFQALSWTGPCALTLSK